MKIEDKAYVLMKIGNVDIGIETAYLTTNHKFTNDIRGASKYMSRKTALIDKTEYELTEKDGYESDLKVVPLKTTYEW